MANAARLRELLGPYRAGHVNGNGNGSQHRETKKGISSAVCPVAVVYRNGSATCTLELGDEWRVSLRENLLESLRANFSAENVKIIY
jgi:DNA polymerase-3 subunit alpha